MIKLKNKLFCMVLILFSINCFCQKFTYDFDKNGEKDTVKLDKENYAVNINLNNSRNSFEIPEITGYEKISLLKFKSEFINIHYSSSFVSTIDLFIHYKNNKWILTSTLFYSPCQTCENGEVKTCENIVNLDISKINEENIESIVFNEINCKKTYKNINCNGVKDSNPKTKIKKENDSISGVYVLESCQNSRFKLVISKKQKQYFYIILDKKKTIEKGKATITKNKEYNSIMLGLIGGIFSGKDIQIQNYGNAMNEFIHFTQCDEKYLTFIKN